jgi:hypothetical protein
MINKQVYKKLLLDWLPIAFVGFIVIGTSYGLVQRTVRQSANMPQIQLAQDKANVLANADAVQITAPNVAIDKSLQNFEIVYDASGKVLSSNAVLNGTTPQLPSGVLANASKLITLTWQPQPNVRVAAVIQPISGASAAKYVLEGRNLSETERLESSLLWLSIAGGIVAWIGSFVFIVIVNYTRRA